VSCQDRSSVPRRPGAPGHLPAARRPDLVHRPGPFNRDPGGGAGRDPGRGRRSLGPAAAAGLVRAVRTGARSAPAGCSTPRPRSCQ